MCWAGEKARRDTPLKIDQNEDVSLQVLKEDSYRAQIWLQVDLHCTSKNPRVTQLQVVSADGTKVVSATFDACPTVCLGEKDHCDAEWTLTLIDPFGHKVQVKRVVGR